MQNFVSKFEKCRDIHNFDQEFDFERFKQTTEDTEVIKQHLDKLSKWEGDISNYIKHQHSLGLLQLQGKKLKEQLSKRVKQE